MMRIKISQNIPSEGVPLLARQPSSDTSSLDDGDSNIWYLGPSLTYLPGYLVEELPEEHIVRGYASQEKAQQSVQQPGLSKIC